MQINVYVGVSAAGDHGKCLCDDGVAAGRPVIVATHAVLPPDTVDRVLYREGGSLYRYDQQPGETVIPVVP